MAITYTEAELLLNSWVQSDSLKKHCQSVGKVMRKAAHAYGAGIEDELRFSVTGLLHDADYDQWPETHPQRIVAWLEERGEHEIAYAINCHYTRWKRPQNTPLDKALLACDELTGFVMACALVRPGGIETLEPKSVIKKLKDRTFAAKVDRDEVKAGAELLGVDLDKHIAFLISALRE